MCVVHWRDVPTTEQLEYFKAVRDSFTAPNPIIAKRAATMRVYAVFRGVR